MPSPGRPDTQLRPGALADARRVQSMVKMKLAGSSSASTRHPAEARCQAEARKVQSMLKMKPVGSSIASTDTQLRPGAGRRPQSAVDGEDQASGLPSLHLTLS